MKIGFLAMSGIRAHDPKLLQLGLTLPGFVERSKTIASLPSLGLLYLAAVHAGRARARYFEAEADGKEPAEVYRLRPRRDQHVLGPGLRGVRHRRPAAQRGREGRDGRPARQRPAGGSRRARGLRHHRRRRERLAGGGARRRNAANGPRMFERSRFPRRSTSAACRCRATTCSAIGPYNRFTVQTSRGCPWRCDFCASTVMLGRPYRKRPVEHVIRDIRAIRAAARPRRSSSSPTTTPSSTRRGARSCAASWRRCGCKWFTETDISVAGRPGAAAT